MHDARVDPNNPSCLSNQSSKYILFCILSNIDVKDFMYGNSSTSPKSSLTIHGGSLQPNQIYQFMVYMENRQNSSDQATGYVLVTIESIPSDLIAIGYELLFSVR